MNEEPSRKIRKLNGIDLLAESIIKQSHEITPGSTIWCASYKQTNGVLLSWNKIETAYFTNQEKALNFLQNMIPWSDISFIYEKISQSNIKNILHHKGHASFRAHVLHNESEIFFNFDITLIKCVVL